ncbi:MULTISPECIES: 16S rRNA (uracil(1498)-N(3))-methyltransferase [unclassified Thiocapsa]|uniref:16S rRNA (uracil(1498)-N(3))-methyltransferase n=1 Tax=unclassified Thiocapsa TaxID=2641286 RepID=UPI0035B2B409
MRIPRVYVDLPLEPGAALELPSAQARHLTQVLRLPPDAPLVLFNGNGYDYPAHLTRADRGGSSVRVGTPDAAEPIAPLNIHLAVGVSKGERMDYALQKAVELGVGRITPLFAERSQVQLNGPRLERRLDHWRGILIGACEQSGRRRLPHLAAAATTSDWLSKHAGGGLLLDPAAVRPLTALPAPGATVTLLIGPEGGLSPRERASARARGFEGVRLGPRILRTETAPLAAIAVIQALWGDLGV